MDLSQLEKIKTSQELADQVRLDQAQAYLKETDWHVFAMLEDGVPVLAEIKDARTAARETIRSLAPSILK